MIEQDVQQFDPRAATGMSGAGPDMRRAAAPMAAGGYAAQQQQAALARGMLGLLRNALADRSLSWAALLGVSTAFGYAVYQPEWYRIIAASLFASLVWLPLLWKRG